MLLDSFLSLSIFFFRVLRICEVIVFFSSLMSISKANGKLFAKSEVKCVVCIILFFVVLSGTLRMIHGSGSDVPDFFLDYGLPQFM